MVRRKVGKEQLVTGGLQTQLTGALLFAAARRDMVISER